MSHNETRVGEGKLASTPKPSSSRSQAHEPAQAFEPAQWHEPVQAFEPANQVKRTSVRETSRRSKTDRRVLGDAWKNWMPGEAPKPIEADPGHYVVFLTFFALALCAAWIFLVWLAQPRLASLGVAGAGRYLAVGGSIFWLSVPLMLGLHLTPLRFPVGITRSLEWWLVATWPACEIISRLTGFSRDRLGHAFVLMANRMSLRARRGSGKDGILMLAPRCLRPEIMRELRALANERGASFVVATGGEEAREAVRSQRPGAVLAVACERDLVEGLRDVLPRFLVQGLSNRRPEGPCRNSEVDLEVAKDLIDALTRS